MTDRRWWARAACIGTSPSLWWNTGHGPSPKAAIAKAICARCPVQPECLADALDHPDFDPAIRGGLTPGERTELALTRRHHPASGSASHESPAP